MAEVVRAANLRKTYDGLEAVKGVSFQVEEGGCYGLLGPNGAGKTSIIRMIYHLEEITRLVSLGAMESSLLPSVLYLIAFFLLFFRLALITMRRRLIK